MVLTDVEVAIAAAEAGAAVVRSRFHTPLTRIAKEPGDFATNVDIEAEEAILAVIRAARPDDGVVAEESGHTGAAADRTWLVDPLCGTLNYAAHTMLVAVNVALMVGSDVAAAAVADPFAHEVFWTGGGADRDGAYVRFEGVDRPLAPSAETTLVDINMHPAFPALGLLGDREFAGRFHSRDISSSLAVAWVAAGRRAAYLTGGGDQRDSVHFAAGIALCRAAGCVVTGLDGEPLPDSDGGLAVAADAETHGVLVAGVRRHRRPAG